MASFNREYGSGADQGPRQVSTTSGQRMEEIRDPQGNLVGYRPVVDAPAQPVHEPLPVYNINPSAFQMNDPELLERALRGHAKFGEKLQQRVQETQDALDIAAFQFFAGGEAQAPQKVQQTEFIKAPEAVATSHIAMPAPVAELVTYPKNHDVRRAAAKQAPDLSINQPAEKIKKPLLTKRAKRIGAIGLAGTIFVGGGVFAATNLMGGSHEAAVIDNKNASPDASPIDPALIPNLTVAPLVEAFGGCMDENGGGSVLDSGSVKSEVATSWMMGMTGANGRPLKAEFGESPVVYPKVQLESDLDYTACVVAANVANVVTLDLTNPASPIATVNPDLIDPQIRGKVNNDMTKLQRGWSSTDFEPKLIRVEDLMKDGVEQKAIPADVATNFTAAYNDVPNAAAEVQAAEKITVDTIAAEGSAQSEQLKTTIKQKIEVAIKSKVKQLAQDNLTTAKTITVNWTGKQLKALLAKNSPAPKADKFTIPTPKAVLKDFTPITPKTVEQTK